MNVALLHAPDGVELAGVVGCHVGEPARAEADLAPLRALPGAVLFELGQVDYTAINSVIDASYPRGALNYWKSSFVRELSDEAIGELVAQFAVAPSAMSAIVIEHFHGAVCRVGVSDTAVPHRNPGYNLGIFAEWTDPATTDENIAWARETYGALKPYRAQLRYVNYLDEDDTGDAVRAAYGPNYERLVEIKQRYDPENVFHLNHNIDPGPANS
jgi:FAD/FMN-containing dehydrogenase